MSSLSNNDFKNSDDPPNIVQSRHDHSDNDNSSVPIPILNPTNFDARNFLLDEQKDDQKFLEYIVKVINSH